jgi:tRNA pseudouridine32 synthase/23S rRNA pseudouridine746 synthase
MSFAYLPPPNDGLEIIFQDDALLVVNKPCGLLSVPGRGDEKSDCLASRVAKLYPDSLIVHRLDMATSGLMVLARGNQVHRQLSILFQQQMVHKRYLAVVDGIVEPASGQIDLPLSPDWPNRPLQKIDHESGKPSLTCFRVLQHNLSEMSSRVELQPRTGRSHQLRLHMLSMGHPIVGDRLYASTAVAVRAERLLLHATSLAFTHPVTNQPLGFESKAPF